MNRPGFIMVVASTSQRLTKASLAEEHGLHAPRVRHYMWEKISIRADEICLHSTERQCQPRRKTPMEAKVSKIHIRSSKILDVGLDFITSISINKNNNTTQSKHPEQSASRSPAKSHPAQRALQTKQHSQSNPANSTTEPVPDLRPYQVQPH